MTKAEQKKMEKAARSMFITQAFGCVLDAICDSSQNARGNPQIRVNMKSGNRYIFFHRYLQDFNIQIYASGDVDIEFREFCHDIEHILPDRFDDYAVDFVDAHEFQTWRQHVGNLLILTRDKNRAYQDMIYQKKVECYAGDNILAQALNPIAYHKNPQFLPLAAQYGFEAIPHFNKESITSRANIYLQMAIDIWDPEAIKELAGGWTDEEEQEFTKDTRLREFTVEYLGRSWQDALKYGFLSADETNSGRYLRNIHVGDTIYCHIAGYGFLGIGICTSKAVYMKDFCVLVDGVSTSIMKAPWINPEKRDQLVKEKEIFIGVDWKKSVSDESQGYWEKGMTSIPLVAYMLNDRTTHRKVSEHFGYQPE